ncbi:MAG: hypothetical protein R3291_05165 [Thermoplasmata archaeon]|nr:hypothetical protein [Thermoplasmata archaeon]
MTRVSMRRRGKEAVLSFDYDRFLVRAVKNLDQRRYDPTTKEWTVPIHYYADALATLEALGAEVEMDPELADLHERAEVPPKAAPEVSVEQAGDRYVVRFEYDRSLVRAIKKVPGRSFDSVARAWLVPVEEGALDNLLATLREVDCAIRVDPELRP